MAWYGSAQLLDRNAPLPEDSEEATPWNEAVDIVLDGYKSFSDTMHKKGKGVLRQYWIHAPPGDKKMGGAFLHSTTPSEHPYMLLNYYGKNRDVMTLAHELGHGIHYCLSAHQSVLMYHVPLTVAETASVFGEQIVFRSMLESCKTKEERRIMIARKVEDMLNTVVRQTAFCEFERRVHDARKEGELSSDQIGDIWLETQKESLGDAIKFEDGYKNFWMYIPHFFHAPFYVYSYAFGDCLVNSLYSVYLSGSIDDF